MKLNDLEGLIAKLKTDEGKSQAMIKAVELYLVDDIGFYQRTVGLAMRVENYFSLMKLALKKGDDFTYIAALKQLGYFTEGLKFAHGRGYFDREIEFLERLERRIEEGRSTEQEHFIQATNAEQNRDYLRAAQLFEADGLLFDAGRNYSSGKDYLNAIRCYNEARDTMPSLKFTIFTRIGFAKEKLGDLNEALMDFERGGAFYFAARVSKKIGDTEMAGVYEKLDKLFHPELPILILRQIAGFTRRLIGV